MQKRTFCLLVIWFCLVLLEAAGRCCAQAHDEPSLPLAAHNPQICIGYFGSQRGLNQDALYAWGYSAELNCPSGYGMYGAVRSVYYKRHKEDGEYAGCSASEIPFSERTVFGDCCPLPAADILTDHHLEALKACPPNHIVTGAAPIEPSCPDCSKHLHCTRINTKRYQLGPTTRGVFWGFSTTFWWNDTRYMRLDIPPAIRYGLSRLKRFFWDPGGCTGYPFGSVIVEDLRGRACQSLGFAELQYRGLPGDPPQGTPVKMFPDCVDISDYFEHDAVCIPKPEVISNGKDRRK